MSENQIRKQNSKINIKNKSISNDSFTYKTMRNPDILSHKSTIFLNSKTKTNSFLNSTLVHKNNSNPSRSKSNKKNEINEEEINIEIPKPYPHNTYLLIDDPKLIDSKYTNYLNNLYPPRKYVKSNLTSSNKINKYNNKKINIKFLNPKLNSIGLEHIHNNLDELSLDYINSLPEALTIIQKLKIKIIEYESTNNKNIETAFIHLKDLENENEFLKCQLKEAYIKLGTYSDKYGDEILNNHVYEVINKFKEKWAKIKILKFLKYAHRYNKFIENQLTIFDNKKEFNLKFKGFLGLQKHLLNLIFIKKIERKKEIENKSILFKMIHLNKKLNLNHKNFQFIHKTISIMFILKRLKLDSIIKKSDKNKRKISLNFYHSKLLRKSFYSFKINLISNVKYGFNNAGKMRISFTNFLQNTNKYNFKGIKRQRLVDCLKKLKNIIINTHQKQIAQYSYKNKLIILNKSFDIWKKISINTNQNIEYIIRLSKGISKIFFKQCQKNIYLKDFENNIKLIQSQVFFKQMKLYVNKRKAKILIFPNILKKKEYKHFFNSISKTAISNKLYKEKTIPFIKKFFYSKLNNNYIIRKQQICLFDKINEIKLKMKYIEKRNMLKLFFNNLYILLNKKKKISAFRKKHNSLETYFKCLNKLRTFCLFRRILKIKLYYSSLVDNLKKVIEDKTFNFINIEDKNKVMMIQINELKNFNIELFKENEYLKKEIQLLEIKMTEKNKEFSHLFEKNLSDIKGKYFII